MRSEEKTERMGSNCHKDKYFNKEKTLLALKAISNFFLVSHYYGMPQQQCGNTI
jgi:hypothetical protein